jgi:lipoate-protein ligase A
MQYLIDNLDSQDPAVNLALEEYAVRHLDVSHDYCLLYINQPCIVLGRHQNAFEEINYPYVLQNGIPVYRRISGGGTVFHDPGNLSFSFITRYDKKKFNNYVYFNRPIIDALNAFNIPAEMNGRNDIMIGEKKVSGNAQFTSLNRMLSHGTLLFNAKLKILSEALKSPPYQVTSRAIKSVRSQVTNISEYLDNSFDINRFTNLIKEFIFGQGNPIPVYSFSKPEWDEIRNLAETKYRTWEWNLGESPAFSLERQAQIGNKDLALQLEVEKGKIVGINLQGSQLTNGQIKDLNETLNGTPFSTEEIGVSLDRLDFSRWPVGINGNVIIDLLFNG